MNFRSGFKHRHAILPVIHASDQMQVMANAEWAYYAKADGVFLINQSRRGHYGIRDMASWAARIKRSFPDFWVGINFLGKPVEHTFLEVHKWEGEIDGLWADNAGISEDNPEQPFAKAVKKFVDAHCQSRGRYQRKYFGGVAFKYQEPVKDLAAVCKAAMPFVDVLTTSGPKTGEEASVEKIKAIREAVGQNFPIAIASGISEFNILNYLPYADCFLVSTSISDSYEYFNAAAIERLVTTVRRWKEPAQPAVQPAQAQVLEVALDNPPEAPAANPANGMFVAIEGGQRVFPVIDAGQQALNFIGLEVPIEVRIEPSLDPVNLGLEVRVDELIQAPEIDPAHEEMDEEVDG